MEIKSTETIHESENNDWYIFKNCNKHGPLTAKEISHLLVKNQITKDHHIWHARYNNWVAIKDVEIFKNIGFELPIPKEQDAFIEDDHLAKSQVVTAGYSQTPSFWRMLKNFFSSK